MGYESKLYVVEKSKISYREDGKVFGEVVSSFDLCKVYPVSNVIRTKYKPTNCYIYGADDNEEIVEDLYGEPLLEIPISDMISILENATRKGDYYRRYAPCLALLRGFELDKWGDLVVLHYGH